MKHHYVHYHGDIEYPGLPFKEVEMTILKYDLIKKEWIHSEETKATLIAKRDLRKETSKKRKYNEL